MKKFVLHKRLLQAAAVTAALSLMTACGAGAASSTAASAASGSSAAGSEAVTLTVCTQMIEGDGGTNTAAFYERLEQYKKDYPNVEIVLQTVDPANYPEKMRTLAVGDQLPDIFELESAALSTFVDTGRLQEMDEYLAENPYYKEHEIGNAISEFVQDDVTYGIPLQMCPNALLFYNKAMLKDCGYDAFPTQWNDFMDLIGKLNEKGITPMALGNKEQWVAVSCIMSNLSDRFTGTEWFNSVVDGTGAQFTDPEFVASLEALVEMRDAKAFNEDMNSLGTDGQRAMFNNGKAAMYMEGSWAIPTLEDAIAGVKENIGVTVLPAVEAEKGDAKSISGAAGYGYAMRNDLSDAAKEAAYNFITYTAGEGYCKALLEAGGDSAFSVDEYDAGKLSDAAKQKNELLKTTPFCPGYDVSLPPEVYQVEYEEVQGLLIGTTTPQAVAQDMQDAWDMYRAQ